MTRSAYKLVNGVWRANASDGCGGVEAGVLRSVRDGVQGVALTVRVFCFWSALSVFVITSLFASRCKERTNWNGWCFVVY